MPAVPPPDSLVPSAPPAAPTPPPGTGPAPSAPINQPSPVSPTPAAPTGPAPLAVAQGAAHAGSPATPHDPRAPVTPAGGPNALATGGGGTGRPAWQPGSPAAPSVEGPRPQAINYLRFDLAYEVEQRGPSGISRIDLYVTRDDGRRWDKWSQHDGRELPVRVALDVVGTGIPQRHPEPNRHREGLYGFRLVPVSGAGLSGGIPNPGDAPDLRVVVDITPPLVKLYPPVSDPAQPDALLIVWEATDSNLGEDPVTIEWAEHQQGPWRPVTGPSGDGFMPAAGGAARGVPNTGRYPWRVPAGLPPRVYLKVTARDAAGNVTPVVTPGPVLIDLAKPRATIHGIVTGPPTPRQ
jgi:hypothetical protein